MSSEDAEDLLHDSVIELFDLSDYSSTLPNDAKERYVAKLNEVQSAPKIKITYPIAKKLPDRCKAEPYLYGVTQIGFRVEIFSPCLTRRLWRYASS
ncbi:hypothetical protein OUZ56_025324 [Daphnia magna]|uniref:Uncharacterized protein n=1 Tax=Daphnia magna TaxID=35525 RepID=A0ABQ9ZJH8_9CRUS|nr:hypothetical protein OUZ56_025324 [Daphnia magna]